MFTAELNESLQIQSSKVLKFGLKLPLSNVGYLYDSKFGFEMTIDHRPMLFTCMM